MDEIVSNRKKDKGKKREIDSFLNTLSVSHGWLQFAVVLRISERPL